MAGILTHVVYAQKVSKNNFDFMTGAAIVDINYLGVVERSLLHINSESDALGGISYIKSILSTSATKDFMEGIVYHSKIEKQWSRGINVETTFPYFSKALKLWADELFWDQFTNGSDFIKHMLSYSNTQLISLIPLEIQNKWFAILQNYFSVKPDNNLRLKMSKMLSIDEKQIIQINEFIDNFFRNNTEINDKLHSNLQNALL